MGKFLKKYWVVLVLLLAVAAGAIIWFNPARTAAAESAYQTTPIERGKLTATIGATGTVRARQSAVLIWQAAGTVDTVNVKVGDNVPCRVCDGISVQDFTAAEHHLAEADLANARMALDDLLNSDAALAQAAQNLANAKQALEDAERDVIKLDYRRASDDLLDQTQAEIDIANKQISLAEDAYKRVSNRPDGDSSRRRLC
jgi:HlyD family secretion protein